ncbi:hypothetical protein AYK26_07755 [Euryarchaeota archaeon SM23-78]|nr:MAG: hypothetical protein AYK26_07755 [Euryarchaeota archaeon SM23-78]
MSEGMIFGAKEILTAKHIPEMKAPSIFLPSEAYRSLYGLLDVTGRDGDDPDIQNQVKYIYDTLKEKGKPPELLVSLITQLGIIPVGETKVNRIWKYLQLRKKANEALKYYQLTREELRRFKKEGKK